MFHAIEEMKKKTSKNTYHPTLEEQQEGERKAKIKSNNLRQLFLPFFSSPLNMPEYIELFQLFGFKDHGPLLPYQDIWCKKNTLIEKIKMLLRVFTDPAIILVLPPLDFGFLFCISAHDHCPNRCIKKSGEIKKTTRKISFRLPTSDKLLESLAGLSSVVVGFKNMVDTVNQKLIDKIALKDIPLFVFDQSNQALFQKNRRFIDKLNLTYACSIIHLSREDILHLAQALDIEDLINTTKRGLFGYGGMRNSVFLIAPILRHIFTHKIKHEQILLIDPEKLMMLFNQYVLGGISPEAPAGDVIFMLHDDMQIPEANIFSHLLLMANSQDINLTSMGFDIGRATKYRNASRL